MAATDGQTFCSQFAQADGAIGTVFILQGGEVAAAPVAGPGTPVNIPTPPWGGGIDWGGSGYYDASTGILTVYDMAVDSSWIGKYVSLESLGITLAMGSCPTDLGLFLVLAVTGPNTVSLGPANPAGFTGSFFSGWYQWSAGPFSGFGVEAPGPPTQPTWSGMVNVDGFDVDWVSGDLFIEEMIMRLIELGSPAVGYLVTAVGMFHTTLNIATAYMNPDGGESATNIPYSV